MLKYTAALDAEFIYQGECKTLDYLPVSPSGIVSPALISKACLNLLNAEILIVDLGAHIKPQCPYLAFRDLPSRDISSGQAMSYEEVLDLFNAGKKLAEELKTKKYPEIIIAECVVGGTTTALGLLSALGYECYGILSSSFPDGNHELKETLVRAGLKRASELNSNFDLLVQEDPLHAVAALGDPIQAWIAGLSITLSKNSVNHTLAGGTQMLAVKALIKKLKDACQFDVQIVTTPWVVEDKSANFKRLAAQCFATEYHYAQIFDILNLPKLNQEIELLSQKSCTRPLKFSEIVELYSQGHVKEGVGMGALLHSLLSCTALTDHAKLSL